MRARLLPILGLCGLTSCAVAAKLQGVEGQIGPAVEGIDDSIYSVAIAKYKSAQMFKAQIDGNLVLPPLPPPTPAPTVMPSPVPEPVPTPMPAPAPTITSPGGPIVTPSARHRHRMQSIGVTAPDVTHAGFDWDKWGRPVLAGAAE